MAFMSPWLWAPGALTTAVLALISPPASPPSRPESLKQKLFQTLLSWASFHALWGLPVGAPGTLRINDWVPSELNIETGLQPDRPPLSSTRIEATVTLCPHSASSSPFHAAKSSLSFSPRSSLHPLQPMRRRGLPAFCQLLSGLPFFSAPETCSAHLALGLTGM